MTSQEYDGSLDNLLLQNPSEEYLCHTLYVIAKQVRHYVIVNLTKKPEEKGFDPYSLFPSEIVLHLHPETGIFYAKPGKADKNCSEICKLMQVDEDPRRAFAYLMLYVTFPSFRKLFLENKIRVQRGKFQYFHNEKNKWLKLPQENNYVVLAQLLLAQKVTLEQTIEFLENPNSYDDLICELGNAIEQVDPLERVEARRNIKKYERTIFMVLARSCLGDMIELARLLSLAEKGDVEEYENSALKLPEHAAFLKEICDARSIEDCRANGKIQVSGRALEMILFFAPMKDHCAYDDENTPSTNGQTDNKKVKCQD